MSVQLILIIAILILLLPVAVAAKSFAPWVPTRKKDVQRVINLAGITPGEIWFELGCGDGRTTIAAAKAGARATGIELAWPILFLGKLRALGSPARIKFGSLFRTDLRAADVVYFFGMPESITKKLKTKLETDLKSGTRVISYAFPVDGWKPVRVDKPTEDDIEIYLYRSV